MKKISLLFCLILFGVNLLFAQNGRISGVISDQNSKERIPFASIQLFGEKDAVPTGAISTGDGSFGIDNLKYGKYKALVYFMGYKTDTLTNIVLSKQFAKVDLGFINLVPISINVKEVQIQANARTSQNKIDRQVYRASDFETAKGGNAAELLSKLPSVSVDPDGTVSVRGTTDFVVYLNGKPTQMDPSALLGQISGSQIDNVEVISIPTAKYDAQGKGGIININTKKTGMDGLSVSVNGLLGGAPWSNLTDRYSGFRQNDNRYGSGVNLVYFKNKLTLSGGLNFNNRNVNGSRVGDARILVKDGIYRHMVADGERPEWYDYLSANLGVDYQLSKMSTLSGSFFYGNRKEGRSAFYIYNIFYADKNNSTIPGFARDDTWIYNPNTDSRYGQFQNVSVDFSHSFGKTKQLRISALYEHSGLSRELHNQNFRYDRSSDKTGQISLEYRQTDDTPLDGYRLSVDYSAQLPDGSKIGIGLQPQFFSIAGNFSYDTLGVKSNQFYPYTDLENGIDVTRGVYAAYVDYSGKYRKFNYIAGLRLEYADQSVDLLKSNYFSLFDGVKKSSYKDNRLDFFPNLHLEWELSEKAKLGLASSRRISRPPVKNLAPFLYRRHLEVYEVGDPQLQPEYLVNAEVSYDRKIKKHSLNVTGFYRGVNNAVYRVNTVTNENLAVMAVTKEEVLIRSYTNAGNSKSLGAELNANLDAGKYAKFFIGGSLYNYSVSGNIFGYQVNNSSLNWSLKSNMNLIFSKELKMGLDFNLKSATVTAQGQNDLFYLFNSSFNYSPAKLKGWELSLRVLDFFNSNIEGLDTRAFNKAGKEIFYQETTYYRKGGILEIGLTYSFNKKGKGAIKSDNTFGKEQF